MARHGRRSARDQRRRQLGQNFLVDPHAIARLVRLAEPDHDDVVVDLGAGRGAITDHIAPLVDHVVAVERDRNWLTALHDIARRHGNVEVVAGDLMRVPLPLAPFKVVASPPFNLSTDLLRRLLAADVPLRDVTLVLQLQAARRLAGRPATGRFALGWSPWFHLEVAARLDKSSFRPVPGVDIGVLTARARAVPWLSPARFAAWDGFVEQVFTAPGRTVGERLSRVVGPRAAGRAFVAAGFDAGRPPSRVPADAWVELFRALQAGRL